MTLEVKEAAVCVRKFLLFALKSIHSSAASHPFVSSFALSLLLLYSCFPSLSFFLFSCSPVLLCTALLLGALLCYGDAIVPDIEVHDNLIGGVSSLKVERSVEDLSKLDADVDRKIEIEGTVKNSAPDARSERSDACLASSSLIEEPVIPDIDDDDKINGGVLSLKLERSVDKLLIKKDDLSELDAYVDRRVENESVKHATPDARSESYGAFLASSSLIEETNKIGGQNVLYHSFEEHRESLMIEQPEVHINELDKGGGEYVLYQGFHENRQKFMKEPDAQVRIHGASIGVSEGIEGLKVNINKPELDDWIDSPLSSLWQPINMHDAASDSESDHLESSSPDASMSDILPMLDELHPLLHSEATHHALQSMDNSDVELPQHQESDDDSVEQQDEHQLSEKDDSSMVVTWTADDQRNVMDLGSSDLERNRRLESLMARRRARKNQVIIFEKDLIDLHSNDKAMDELSRFHHQISPISAPRRNPFDFPDKWEESMGPGSAPSILLSQKNPFDFRCEGAEDGNKKHFCESSSQLECLPFERGWFSRRNKSFAPHSSFPSDVLNTKPGSSRLKPNFVAKGMDSEGNCTVDLHGYNTKLMAAEDAGTWLCGVSQEELKEATVLSVPVQDIKSAEQYSQSYEAELVNVQSKLGQIVHFGNQNTLAFEAIHKSIDASFAIQEEEDVIEFDSHMQDAWKHEIVDDKQNELNVLCSSEKIKDHDSLPEELENLGQSVDDSKAGTILRFMQTAEADVVCQSSETEGNSSGQSIVHICDSSPFESENFLANLSSPKTALLSSGIEDNPTSCMDSNGQEDAVEVASYSGALEEDLGSKAATCEIVHGRIIHDATASSGVPVQVSHYMNLLVEKVGPNEDFDGPNTPLALDHHLRLPLVKDDANKSNLLFFASLSPSAEEDKKKSAPELTDAYAFEVGLEHSKINDLESRPILLENLEDTIFDEVATEVVSYSRALEEEMGSGVAPFEIVHERQTLDPKFGNERAGVVSPLKLLVENEGLNEDVGHHSRISSREVANKSNLLFFDGLPSSKTEDKQESVMKVTESYSFGVSVEHSRVSTLELRPILEENSKDIKYEEDAMQVVSYSRVLEEDISLEVAPFEIVNESKIHDSKSNVVGAVSPVNLLVANVGLTEDFGDQDTSVALDHHSRFPSGDNEDFGDQDTSLSLNHHSRFPSREDDANKSNLLFSECLHFSETEDKQELVTKLTEASTLRVGLEHPQVSNLELRPILKENLEDIKFEEDAMKVVSYSRVLEEDMGLEVAPREIVHESKIYEPKSNGGGKSAVFPLNFLVENEGLVDHHSRFPLGEDTAKMSNLLLSDGLPPLETEDKQELVTQLIEASNHGVGLEHSQVNNLELRPIRDQNLEDIKFKEDALEVVSYSRVLEKDVGLEEASVEIVHGRKIQDPTSSNIRPGEVSPYMNLLAKNVGLNKDFGDQDTSLVLDHHLRFSSTEDDANRSNLLFSVGLSSSETEDKHVSVMQLTESNAFGVGLEDSQVSDLELRPILGENMEDFKLEEEHVNLLKSTLSMPEEPNVGLFSCGQESSFQKNTEESGELDKENCLDIVSVQLNL